MLAMKMLQKNCSWDSPFRRCQHYSHHHGSYKYATNITHKCWKTITLSSGKNKSEHYTLENMSSFLWPATVAVFAPRQGAAMQSLNNEGEASFLLKYWHFHRFTSHGGADLQSGSSHLTIKNLPCWSCLHISLCMCFSSKNFCRDERRCHKMWTSALSEILWREKPLINCHTYHLITERVRKQAALFYVPGGSDAVHKRTASTRQHTLCDHSHLLATQLIMTWEKMETFFAASHRQLTLGSWKTLQEIHN